MRVGEQLLRVARGVLDQRLRLEADRLDVDRRLRGDAERRVEQQRLVGETENVRGLEVPGVDGLGRRFRDLRRHQLVAFDPELNPFDYTAQFNGAPALPAPPSYDAVFLAAARDDDLTVLFERPDDVDDVLLGLADFAHAHRPEDLDVLAQRRRGARRHVLEDPQEQLVVR